MNNPLTQVGKSLSQAVFSIAGSDPCGGAGIQADLKTFTAVGVYGAAAITCLTAQNTKGVQSYREVSADFVAQQIGAVLDDLPVSHIKTGMIGTAAVAEVVGNFLRDFRGEIICDPVLASSHGESLFSGNLDSFCQNILSRTTVVTPNLHELQNLTGVTCTTTEEILKSASRLLEQYPRLRAVVIKGGHIDEKNRQVVDTLLLKQSRGHPTSSTIIHDRVPTRNTHGTGCTFAAAYAAYHLLHGNDREAFRGAVSFMDQVINRSKDHTIGHGKGPLLHHLFRPY